MKMIIQSDLFLFLIVNQTKTNWNIRECPLLEEH